MEPKNGGLEDDFPFQLGDFWGSMLINFQGCKDINHIPETNSSHPQMDGWNTIFLLGAKRPMFRGKIFSFREGKMYFVLAKNKKHHNIILNSNLEDNENP